MVELNNSLIPASSFRAGSQAFNLFSSLRDETTIFRIKMDRLL